MKKIRTGRIEESGRRVRGYSGAVAVSAGLAAGAIRAAGFSKLRHHPGAQFVWLTAGSGLQEDRYEEAGRGPAALA